MVTHIFAMRLGCRYRAMMIVVPKTHHNAFQFRLSLKNQRKGVSLVIYITSNGEKNQTVPLFHEEIIPEYVTLNDRRSISRYFVHSLSTRSKVLVYTRSSDPKLPIYFDCLNTAARILLGKVFVSTCKNYVTL